MLSGNGKVFDAIRLYRRAVQIEPNIEYKMYQANIKINSEKSDVTISNKNNKLTTEKKSSHLPENKNNEDEELDDLVESFSKHLALENSPVCQPNSSPDVIRTSKHISCLPIEVFIHILKFVISNDLDMRSLERFGETCKGFFLLSRENELWRKACEKVWKNNLSVPPENSTWRDTYINRCRVLFEGCYISKITYQRLGENSFQDQFYSPVHIVEYFRLIRFFPNGELLMMTSADELQSSVNKLRNRKNAMQMREILKGHYHYQDNHVLIVIKKQRTFKGDNYNFQRFKKRAAGDSDDSLTFFLELEITSTSKKRKFTKLMWKNYSVSQVRDGGQEITSDFDLRSSTKYPPFYFSHVKSYHAQSNDLLC